MNPSDYKFAVSSRGTLFVSRQDIASLPEIEFSIATQLNDANPELLRINGIQEIPGGVKIVAESAQECRVSLVGACDRETGMWTFEGELTNLVSRRPLALLVAIRFADTGVPRWLIPGVFCKHNRLPNCARTYPGFSREVLDPERFLSNYWAFRADRSSCPGVFAWTDHCCAYVGTEERFGKGISGIHFRSDGERVEIGACFPYREEPVKYSFCHASGTAPETTWMELGEGERVAFLIRFCVERPNLHSYAPIQRALYYQTRAAHPLNPWITADVANDLLSYGLATWHYSREHKVLFDTCSFDKYFGKRGGYVDREQMHVSWVSGIPTAFALLWHAREKNDAALAEIALSVLDKIAAALSPLGTFWGLWRLEGGWDTGWNPQPTWLHTRTLAEATLFLLRSLRLELASGHPRKTWSDAIRSNLDFAIKCQREDGSFGTYYNVETGAVDEWEGAGGILWIAALTAGASFFQVPEYRDAALRAAEFYARFVEDEFIYGTPEDVHLTPTSEDGYNALLSYTMLYEQLHDDRWLALAQRAADWALTFRFRYNVAFSKDTILGAYDFRTRGGDIASVSNAHIHNYGLICHPEMLLLSFYLDDLYYRERAEDHLACFHQFIAREDGDFGARKGMISEQWYHTDWWQPKGHLLALSHAWCAGLLIYANLCEKQRAAQ